MSSGLAFLVFCCWLIPCFCSEAGRGTDKDVTHIRLTLYFVSDTSLFLFLTQDSHQGNPLLKYWWLSLAMERMSPCWKALSLNNERQPFSIILRCADIQTSAWVGSRRKLTSGHTEEGTSVLTRFSQCNLVVSFELLWIALKLKLMGNTTAALSDNRELTMC